MPLAELVEEINPGLTAECEELYLLPVES